MMSNLLSFQSLHGLWALWIFYWFVSAWRVRRTARTETSAHRSTTLLIMIPAVALLANTGLNFGPLNHRFVPDTDQARGVGLMLTVAGLAITVWARIHLGQFWSARVSLKEGHQLIQSGPYARVRHPIYSGLLLALLGTALFVGEYRAILAVLLVFIAHRQKAVREERLLAEQFGEAFHALPQTHGSVGAKIVLLKIKNGRADPLPSATSKTAGPYFPLLTAFLSSFPGVNLATLRAAILMVAPVCGFRPLRALRCETENVPNPIKATRSPFLRAAVTLSTAVSIAVVACALEILQAPAMRSTRSALFMLSPDKVLFSRARRRGSLVPVVGTRCHSLP